MTEEQKQAHIEAAHKWIEVMNRYIENHPQDISAPITLGLYQVALSALTAQPVKLPDYTPEVYPNHSLENQRIKSRNDAISDCADAIRAAGYQVEGE